MKTNGYDSRIEQFQSDEPSLVPAIVTCVTCVAGSLAAVMIATGPWLALYWL